MAVNYRTMKPAKTLSVDEGEEHGPLRAYECEVCHGVSFERCTNPERLTCRLCNEKAPVLESYRMALNTLGWHCSEDRRALGLGFNLGFSSFDFVRIDDDITYIDTEFEYKQASVIADLDGFIVSVGDEEKKRRFVDGPDAGGDQFTPRVLAQEVVNRVRRDLKYIYGTEED